MVSETHSGHSEADWGEEEAQDGNVVTPGRSKTVSSNEDEFGPNHIPPSAQPQRRYSISSAGSEYDLSSSDTAKARAKSKAKKVRASPGRETSRKRTSESPAQDERPAKRLRVTFSRDYLSLLNADIEDAAARLVALGGRDLADSQVGLVYWTAAEKVLFYEALSRLGPDDASGIAARLRTKSTLEVAQYIRLLGDTIKEKRLYGPPPDVGLASIPAAVELSQACCDALEEAADAISVRQESYEALQEKKRWGPGRWLISHSTIKSIVKMEGPAPDLKSVELFRAEKWLWLSQRFFLNSASLPDNNWTTISDEPPQIQTTALEDFYSLAVSLTRRLVAATIFVSEARVRSKSTPAVPAGKHVRPRDVVSAVALLGLPATSQRFWARCPRRIGLDVYDDESWERSVGEGEEEPEPMCYDDVEEALGGVDDGVTAIGSNAEGSELECLSDTPSVDLEDGEETEEDISSGEEDKEENEEVEEDVGYGHGSLPGVDEEEVQREAKELFVFSALNYPGTKRAKRTLRTRIRLAMAREMQAEAEDARAAYHEEGRLWTTLGRAPPESPVKPKAPGDQLPKPNHPVDDAVYTRPDSIGGWKARVPFVPSRWEFEDRILPKEETKVR